MIHRLLETATVRRVSLQANPNSSFAHVDVRSPGAGSATDDSACALGSCVADRVALGIVESDRALWVSYMHAAASGTAQVLLRHLAGMRHDWSLVHPLVRHPGGRAA